MYAACEYDLWACLSSGICTQESRARQTIHVVQMYHCAIITCQQLSTRAYKLWRLVYQPCLLFQSRSSGLPLAQRMSLCAALGRVLRTLPCRSRQTARFLARCVSSNRSNSLLEVLTSSLTLSTARRLTVRTCRGPRQARTSLISSARFSTPVSLTGPLTLDTSLK